jgi:hypothetical protein
MQPHTYPGDQSMSAEPERPLPEKDQLPRTRILNVAGVPFHVWQKARANALASDISFRDFVIRLLDNSQPVKEANATGSSPGQ